MNLTPEQLKQLFDGGFISTDDYHSALIEYVKSNYAKEFFDGRSINPDFVRVPLSEDVLASLGCAMYDKPHPEWLHAYLKWKKAHTVNCSDEHELSFEAGFAEGVSRTSELESRVEEMAMSSHKSTEAIYMRIRKAADALDNGDVKKAEIILLRMLKDML